MELKARLLKEMDEARDTLWRELASIDDYVEISPGMTKIKIFAHIAGWEALVFEAFRAHFSGVPAVSEPYPGVDAMNAEFLTQKQGATAASVKLECEINRFAINTLLATVSDADLDTLVHFRWGDESITQFFRGAIDHEREHADEIVELRRAGRL